MFSKLRRGFSEYFASNFISKRIFLKSIVQNMFIYFHGTRLKYNFVHGYQSPLDEIFTMQECPISKGHN